MEELIQAIHELLDAYKDAKIVGSAEYNSEFKNSVLTKLEDIKIAIGAEIGTIYGKASSNIGTTYDDILESDASEDLSEEYNLPNEILFEIKEIREHNMVVASDMKDGFIESSRIQQNAKPAEENTKEQPHDIQEIAKDQQDSKNQERYIEKAETITNNNFTKIEHTKEPSANISTKNNISSMASNIAEYIMTNSSNTSNSYSTDTKNNVDNSAVYSSTEKNIYSSSDGTISSSTSNIYNSGPTSNTSNNSYNTSINNLHKTTEYGDNNNVTAKNDAIHNYSSNVANSSSHNDTKHESNISSSINNSAFNAPTHNTISNNEKLYGDSTNTTTNTAPTNIYSSSDAIKNDGDDTVNNIHNINHQAHIQTVLGNSSSAIPHDIKVTLQSEAAIEKLVYKLDSMPAIIANSIRDAIGDAAFMLVKEMKGESHHSQSYTQPANTMSVDKRYRS